MSHHLYIHNILIFIKRWNFKDLNSPTNCLSETIFASNKALLTKQLRTNLHIYYEFEIVRSSKTTPIKLLFNSLGIIIITPRSSSSESLSVYWKAPHSRTNWIFATYLWNESARRDLFHSFDLALIAMRVTPSIRSSFCVDQTYDHMLHM